MSALRWFRLIIGFIVAPLIPGVLFGAVGELMSSPANFWWCLRLAAAVGYPTAIVCGIPAYILTQRRRLNKLGNYLVAGLILGLVPFCVATVPGTIIALLSARGSASHSALYGLPGLIIYLPISALYGGFATFCFWFIARPDRII